MLKMLYNIDVTDENDPFIRLVDEAVRAGVEGLATGKYFVEFLPVLKNVPAWFPGAGFQSTFAKGRMAIETLRNDAYMYMKEAMVSARQLTFRW